MWYDEAVIYQIYPLGLCGAPLQNDGDPSQADQHRLLRVLDWVDHIKALGATCVLFNPLFESDAHGYDTRDYNKVDRRLGTNDDLKQVCAALHAAGIRVLLDGVFNHVGRGFWAFKDVQEKKWDSPYKDWFHISFDGNTNYNDGFWYEAWEGCNELVKLNLQHPDVKNYLFDAVRNWVRTTTSTACAATWPTAWSLGLFERAARPGQQHQAGICPDGRDSARRL